MKTAIELASGMRLKVPSWSIHGIPLVVTKFPNTAYRISHKHTGCAAGSRSFGSVALAKRVAKAFWHSLTEKQQQAVDRGIVPSSMRASVLKKLNAAETQQPKGTT